MMNLTTTNKLNIVNQYMRSHHKRYTVNHMNKKNIYRLVKAFCAKYNKNIPVDICKLCFEFVHLPLTVSVQSIETKLQKYYQGLGQEYEMVNGVGKFGLWAENNGYDTQNVLWYLHGDIQDQYITTFDENFPLPNGIQDSERMLFISCVFMFCCGISCENWPIIAKICKDTK